MIPGLWPYPPVPDWIRQWCLRISWLAGICVRVFTERSTPDGLALLTQISDESVQAFRAGLCAQNFGPNNVDELRRRDLSCGVSRNCKGCAAVEQCPHMLSLPWKVFFRKVPSGMKNRIANANTSFVFLNLPHASQKLYALE